MIPGLIPGWSIALPLLFHSLIFSLNPKSATGKVEKSSLTVTSNKKRVFAPAYV